MSDHRPRTPATRPAEPARPRGAVVLAGLSVRVMAESLARAGVPVIALDVFGDADTRAASLEWQAIGTVAESTGGGAACAIDPRRLARALAQVAQRHPVQGWVAGSGFEALTAWLGPLAGVPLLGMTRATVAAVRDPRRFFAGLQALGLPHPAVRFSAPPPGEAGDWLLKDGASQGGAGVRDWATLGEDERRSLWVGLEAARWVQAGPEAGCAALASNAPGVADTVGPRDVHDPHDPHGPHGLPCKHDPHGRAAPPGPGMPCHRDPGREPAFAGDEATTPGAWPYWQRREHGVPVSALFLADGRDAQVLGISEQQVEGDALAPATPRGAGGGAAPVARPYAFAGALAGLPPALAGRGFEAALEAACRRLARHFGLRGLCSLDALAGPQGLRCLEVNARPSATLALHDGAVPGGLMAAHVAACRGEGLPGPRMPPAAAGGDARGFRVVVAPRAAGFGPAALRAAARTPWCHDRPAAPQALAAGQPVCTVRAEGATRDAVHALLAQRAAEVLQWLDAAPLAGQAAAQAPAQEPVREPVQPAAAWPVPPPPAVTGERPAAPAAWADPCPNDR